MRKRIDARHLHVMAQAVRQAVFDSILHGADDMHEGPSLTVEPSSSPIAPAVMAAAQPESERASRCALYESCLRHYRRVVGLEKSRRMRAMLAGAAVLHEAPDDDVREAVAHFVAANMQALRDIAVTPTMLQRLHAQLAGVARLSSGWDRASLRERQLYFEKMAIVAVLIDQTWSRAKAQGPAAMAHVQRGARGYLRELFGFDPDRLTLSEDGLSMASITSA
jgi:hypothetical protein